MTDSKAHYNRRRKWAPKARTGCRTCKTRHVKCDEAKPICRRCILSGFRCDGYTGSSKGNGSPSSPNEEVKPESSTEEIIKTEQAESSSISEVTTEEDDDDVEDVEPTNASDFNSLEVAVNPRTPYKTPAEQHALKFFVDMTACMVGRSKAGPYFWQTLVPQAAWDYPSVRHALMAAATLNESLCKRESASGHAQRSELRALNHTNLAIKSLITEPVPMDVVLLTSTVFGILDLFSGNWNNACIHINTGAKLAKQAKQNPSNHPYISFYCEAFASALPSTLQDENPRLKAVEKDTDSGARLHEAVCSLRLALVSFDQAYIRVSRLQHPDEERILYVLDTAKTEVSWLLIRWEEMLDNTIGWNSPGEAGPMVDLSRVESPFSACMNVLEHYLDHGGEFDVPKFEVTMERTLPFFAFAYALSNIQMREDGAELLYRGGILRGRNVASMALPPAQTSPKSPTSASSRRNSAALPLRQSTTPDPDTRRKKKS